MLQRAVATAHGALGSSPVVQWALSSAGLPAYADNALPTLAVGPVFICYPSCPSRSLMGLRFTTPPPPPPHLPPFFL
jgi:hypothetical protein